MGYEGLTLGLSDGLVWCYSFQVILRQSANHPEAEHLGGSAGYVFKVDVVIINSPWPVDAGAYTYILSYIVFYYINIFM